MEPVWVLAWAALVYVMHRGLKSLLASIPTPVDPSLSGRCTSDEIEANSIFARRVMKAADTKEV